MDKRTFTPTPGPWRIAHPLDATNSGRIVLDSTGKECVYAYRRSDQDASECDANALLISAAPELLAALKSVQASLEPHRRFAETFIDRAIAKAEGR